MHYNGFIGRIAEIRLTSLANDSIPTRPYARLSEWVGVFNKRGPGNFKCAVAESVEQVNRLLQKQLMRDATFLFQSLSVGEYKPGFIEFRVNTTAIEDGLCWEGCSLQNGSWKLL